MPDSSLHIKTPRFVQDVMGMTILQGETTVQLGIPGAMDVVRQVIFKEFVEIPLKRLH